MHADMSPWPAVAPWTLGVRGFDAVSQVFHARYGGRGRLAMRPGHSRPAREPGCGSARAARAGLRERASGVGRAYSAAAVLGYRGDVSERRWAGSWLTGVRPAGPPSRYPRERLGLPETGTGAVAGFGVRIVALFIDWSLFTAIAIAALHSRL